MVHKANLCQWFKNLGPHKRIDFMCGMLHMCLPMELRFIGSYVEDLAKKDFRELRESEGKANNHKELSTFKESEGKKFRSKMAIYLALLHSSNRTCSSILFQLLENNVKEYFTVMDSMSEMDIHNILLVLVMAMNHPAFSYYQKAKMFEYYEKALEEADHLLHKHEDNYHSSLILSESCDFRSCDEFRQSPANSPHVSVYSAHSPEPPSKVYVSEIEVKGSRPSDRDQLTEEFRLQVTWSNGEQRDVYRTYEELIDFHNKLVQMFPDNPKCKCASLALPAIKGNPKNHTRSPVEHVRTYTKSLTNLPEHVMQCKFFCTFFEPTHQALPVLKADASTSPRPQMSIRDEPTEPHVQVSEEEESVIATTDTVQPGQGSSSPCLNGEMDSLSPANHLIYDVSTHSPSISLKTASPLVSSPCQSPISLPSGSSRAQSPLGPPDIPDLSLESVLQDLRSRFSLEQLEKMRLEELVHHSGHNPAVCKDLMTAIKTKERESQSPSLAPNGLVETMMWPQPLTHIYQYNQQPVPPMPFHHPFPRHMYPPHIFSYHSYPLNGMGVRPRENSSSNSEHSSPSQSPQLLPGSKPIEAPNPNQVPQTTDSSSEDNDRDKQDGQYKVGGKKSHSAPNSARLSQYEEDSSQNATSVTPPLYHDKMAPGLAGTYGHCGYTSDPTYNAPRPLLPKPAHVNLGIPPHFFINMPDSQKFASRHPTAIPQHMRDGFMHGPNPAFNFAAQDAAGRQLYHIRPSPPSSHFTPLNAGRPIFSHGPQHVTPNPSVNLSNAASNVCNNKMFQGGPGTIPPAPPVAMATKTTVIVNGNDAVGSVPSPQVVEGMTQRNGPQMASVTEASSNVPSVNTVNSSQASNRPSCTSCGCTGAHHPVQPSAGFYPHNMWQSCHNGLIPMQPFVMHQSHYPNGYPPDFFHPAVGVSPMINPGLMNNSNPVFGYNLYQAQPPARVYTRKPKKVACDNCGSAKHLGAECTDASMEAMSGPSLYTYQPKMDSD